MYRSMQEAAGQLVMDAINVGLSAMHKAPEEKLKNPFPLRTIFPISIRLTNRSSERMAWNRDGL